LRNEGPLLDIAGVTKAFGGLRAVDDASFAIDAGTVTALIGPNGAGKTTLFNTITGFMRCDAGRVRFNGQDITGLTPHVIAALGLVRTFQIPRAMTRMTVLDNMMLAAPRQPGEVFGAALVFPRRVARHEQSVRERAYELMRLVRLDRLALDYAGTLSGGQRKLLEFGRILMTEPKMILLDEPMAGVNLTLGIELLDHMLALRKDRGITFLFIEHDMDVVMSYGERVIVMDEGSVIANGTPAKVRADPRVAEAYLGSDSESSSPMEVS